MSTGTVPDRDKLLNYKEQFEKFKLLRRHEIMEVFEIALRHVPENEPEEMQPGQTPARKK